MQERGIGDTKRCSDGGVALVARRANRVVAKPLGPKPPRRVIEQATLDLGGEDSSQNRGVTNNHLAGGQRQETVQQVALKIVQVVGIRNRFGHTSIMPETSGPSSHSLQRRGRAIGAAPARLAGPLGFE